MHCSTNYRNSGRHCQTKYCHYRVTCRLINYQSMFGQTCKSSGTCIFLSSSFVNPRCRLRSARRSCRSLHPRTCPRLHKWNTVWHKSSEPRTRPTRWIPFPPLAISVSTVVILGCSPPPREARRYWICRSCSESRPTHSCAPARTSCPLDFLWTGIQPGKQGFELEISRMLIIFYDRWPFHKKFVSVWIICWNKEIESESFVESDDLALFSSQRSVRFLHIMNIVTMS